MTWLKKVAARLIRWTVDRITEDLFSAVCLIILGALIGGIVVGVWLHTSISHGPKLASPPPTLEERVELWVSKAHYGYTQCREGSGGDICTHAAKDNNGQIYVIRLWCDEDPNKGCRPY